MDRRFGAKLRRTLTLALSFSLLVAACSDDDEGAEDDDQTAGTEEEQEGSGIELEDDALSAELAVGGLDQPTALAFLPDAMLVTEKASGKVKLVRDDEVVGEALDLAVNYFDERGLLGIAVHPDFEAQPFVYLHWTWRGDGDGPDQLLGDDSEEATEVPALGNRVDRFRFEDDALVFDRNIVEFPSNTLDSDTTDRVRGNHDAGPLTFGPDGKLYTMMGDQNLRGQLQNITDGPPPDDEHLSGVILRLNDDGTVPDDNPFFEAGAQMGGEVGENIQMIYVYGVRNSFGLAFEPGSGTLWQTENGDDTYDEINVFGPGANSGWIQLQGPPEHFDTYKSLEVESPDGLDVASYPPSDLAASASEAEASLFALPGSDFTAPVLSWVHPPAVTAIGFVPDDSLGGSEAGSAWVGTVLTDALIRYPLAADGRSLELEGGLADAIDDNTSKGDLTESAEYVVGTGFGTVTDIVHDPDGSLYVVSLDQGSIFRISAAGSS